MFQESSLRPVSLCINIAHYIKGCKMGYWVLYHRNVRRHVRPYLRKWSFTQVSFLISTVNISIWHLKDANGDQEPGHVLLPFLRHVAPLTMDIIG